MLKWSFQIFFDEQEKNQGRVDSVVNGGERLLKENPAAQKDEKDIRETINNTQNSWNTILQRLFAVEQRYVSIDLCSGVSLGWEDRLLEREVGLLEEGRFIGESDAS